MDKASTISDAPQQQQQRPMEYEAPAGVFDELRSAADPDGIRPHWRDFTTALDSLGAEELLRRWDGAKRLILENGVTYNLHADTRGLERPWEFDPIPVLISSAEWEQLESGLTQRARLLEAVLDDLYGPQNLLSEGLLPAELVFAHPSFLRACHGIKPAGGRRLHMYAADIGRAADGRFRVYGDRTQAPAGAGYALENRIVLSRMLPEIYRDCRVRRMAPFFRTLRETLRAAAPRRRDDPRIVLLTSGPRDETYFEHAYLARYLGFALAEAGDLTVRDNTVYLKLLGGLQPVDCLFRRLDDADCDPLELRGTSPVGLPGLVQAVRAGNVVVANSLGSGLVESPALSAFLPALCLRLLGEELKLPSVATWWCGDPAGRRHVLANLERMVVKPTFPGGSCDPIFCETLSAARRRELAEQIAARPRNFVGQERLGLSTTPVLTDGRLEPRHMVLRTFLAASDGGGYALMPGGLCRAGAAADTPNISIQRGGGSKDAWVRSVGPVSFVSLLTPPGRPVELSRAGDDLPSRVADNLFWLGRYLERADGMVRLLRGTLARPADPSGPGELPMLLAALLWEPTARPGAAAAGAKARPASPEAALLPTGAEPAGRGLSAPEAEISPLIFDTDRPGSLASTLAALHRVTRTVRDRLSADAWRILNGLTLDSPEADELDAHNGGINGAADRSGEIGSADGAGRRAAAGLLTEMLNRLINGLSAFCGLMMESMTRSQGWRFLDMGRRLERALGMVNLLRATIASCGPGESPPLEAVLEIADSIMTYRRRYLAGPQAAAVLDLLLSDESNPRSLAFQLAALDEHVTLLPGQRDRPTLSQERRVVMALLTDVRLADAEALAAAGADGRRPKLDALLDRCETELPAVSDALTRHYLSHAAASRALAGGQPDIGSSGSAEVVL